MMPKIILHGKHEHYDYIKLKDGTVYMVGDHIECPAGIGTITKTDATYVVRDIHGNYVASAHEDRVAHGTRSKRKA